MELGIYEQLINHSITNKLSSLSKDVYYVDSKQLNKAEASEYISRYLTGIIKYALSNVKSEDNNSLVHQINLANQVILSINSIIQEEDLDENLIDVNGKLLKGIFSKLDSPHLDFNKRILEITPQTRLTQSELFTGNSLGISLDGEFKKEIRSSNTIYILVSFIRWSGVVVLKDALEEFTNNGGRLKIITTTYMGVTEIKSILYLHSLKNTEIKISYNHDHERLHAKAYLFIRNTGFNTGYIGSSNMSRSALTKGLEWNMKITSIEIPQVIEKFQKTFETYWEDPEFESFNISEIERLKISLKANKKSTSDISHIFYDLTPWPYQKEILEKLRTERIIHNRYKNLVVAATGTGKTMISAFDYKNFKANNEKTNLLFIAHRKEILEQALSTFRHVLKDNNFGELLVDGLRPDNLNILFASVQSFNTQIKNLNLSESYYDFIIIDEVHHIGANSYRPILSRFKPKIVLGLTATPERGDNIDILLDFENKIAAEIRLPEALNRKLLCPFQYFGITDSVDLNNLNWKSGDYDNNQLEETYIKGERRTGEIINNLFKYLSDPNDVIALGFCVGKKHAEFMAKEFNNRGLRAGYLTDDNGVLRSKIKSQLKKKEINYLFVVDIFNEGVDIPEVDTILFLRPTKSLTIFLQQLGRGLRISENKEFLTVLDFVGNARPEYDFSSKFRALIGVSKNSTLKEIEADFPHLPLGCSIILEKKAKEYILENIKNATSLRREKIIQKISQFKFQTNKELTLQNFCEFNHYTIEQIYSKGSWKRLCADAKVIEYFPSDVEEQITKAINLKWLTISSLSYFKFIKDLALNKFKIDTDSLTTIQKKMCLMLHYDIWNGKHEFNNLTESINAIGVNETLNQEIVELMEILIDKIDVIEKPIFTAIQSPITLHGRYTRDQIFSAFGAHTFEKKSHNQEGVKVIDDYTEILFVTLNKSPDDYSPTTLYDDYAISDKIFHWQSQNASRPDKGKGLGYIHHSKNKKKILLFVREQNDTPIGSTMGYISLGQVEYVSHSGSKPMNIKWRLLEPMPAFLLKDSVKMAVG